jgi:hypothetical protein
MPKQRIIPLLLAMSVFLIFPLHAQEQDDGESETEDIPLESDWSRIDQQYTRGDKLFNISLGLEFPLFAVSEWHISDDMKGQMKLGGTGALAYDYFLTPHLALGGEVGGIFVRTIGKSVYYAVPIGFRISYQFVFSSFEFPLTFSLGFAPQKELDLGYFGPFLKFEGGAFWRYNADWSFGLRSSWLFIPQFNAHPEETFFGNFSGLTLSARYHF